MLTPRLKLDDQKSVLPLSLIHIFSPDNNGNYWNNIINNDGFYAKKGSVYTNFVNSRNDQTGFSLTLNSRFTANKAGGLTNPDKDKLGDLAVITATGDYFFLEKLEDNGNFRCV